jgi:hypothetical protein
MLRRHGIILPMFFLSIGLLPGCASFGLKSGVPYFSKVDKQWEPEVEEDKWSAVRKEGRGNRALEDERDPLKPMLMSKEAQDIERNLGYK